MEKQKQQIKSKSKETKNSPWRPKSGKSKTPSLRTITEDIRHCEGKDPKNFINNKCPAMCVEENGLCRRSRYYLGLKQIGPSSLTIALRKAEQSVIPNKSKK